MAIMEFPPFSIMTLIDRAWFCILYFVFCVLYIYMCMCVYVIRLSVLVQVLSTPEDSNFLNDDEPNCLFVSGMRSLLALTCRT